MTEKELKRMGRRELIEIIAAMKKNELELQSRLEKAEQQLADRRIQVANAGSIAEAALSLSGIFDAAQAAADIYLESIHAANAKSEACVTKEEGKRLVQDAEQEDLSCIYAADKQRAGKQTATDAEIQEKRAAFREDVQKVLRT